jgi:hypothetical protein
VFAEINDCAYFDYQRDRVYVRTSPAHARASRRRKRGKGGRRFRVNKRVELSIDECPHCQSKELIPSDSKVRKKVLYDLTFSPGGIR